MIRELENGVRVVTLGEGTTFYTTVKVNQTEESTAICFGNKPFIEKKEENVLQLTEGTEVMIEFTNFQGVASYMKAVTEVIKTWSKDENFQEQIKELSDTLNAVIKI